MRLKSIKIDNYKSFGNENNRLDVETINTIIGKNESGKSNLIECLSNIDFSGIKDNEFFRRFNKNTGKYPIIGMVLEPIDEEKQKYKIIGETKLIFNSQYEIEVSGELTRIIEKNQCFQEYRKKINEQKLGVQRIAFIDQNQRENFNKMINMINNAENQLFINYSFIKFSIEKISSYSNLEEFSKYIIYCTSFLNELNSMLPIFIEVENQTLEHKYTKKMLEDNKESKKMLLHLLKCMDFSFEKLMEYWKLNSQDDKINFEEEFNEKLSNVIERFNNFYSQEKVEMKATFEYDSLNFVVKTTKKYMNFDERSNGLKWYLNIYIQILSKTDSDNLKNYIILIDEPGVYLHVNAQKELLNLFEDFAEKGNQIIYTTHSPFMIYKDKIYRTRIIIKDNEGNSNIGNKYYSLPHKMGSKSETLTPLLTALGMNMNHNILVFESDKTNVITEGISDYNYIRGYYQKKNIVNVPNIIPSTSVSNIHNIASILIGWGCKIKIILDQDSEGRKQFNILTKKLLIDSSDIIFSDGTNESNKNISHTIEDNFSNDMKSKIGITNEDYDEEKAYYSLEALKKVENNELEYDEETLSNFEKIVNQLN